MIRDAFPGAGDPGFESQEDPDIVVVILRMVVDQVPSLDVQLAHEIETQIRAMYGGRRVRIPKRGKHLNPQERQAVFEDALTNAPTPELLRKHRISLATLKRVVKRGPF